MKYNYKYFYHKLELDQIFEKLNNFICLPNSRFDLDNMEEINEIEALGNELNNVYEAYRIIISYGNLPLYISSDYNKTLDIAYKGGILSPKELWNTVLINSTIRMNQALLANLIKNNFDTNFYRSVVEQLVLLNDLDKKIRNAIGEDSYVLDDASVILKGIRNKLKGIDSRIKEKLKEIIAHSKDQLAESIVVIRDDCYCLAVKAEYKNSFNGILHDNSASNLTAYMEPYAIANLSSEKERLKKAEKEEIERILQVLSNCIKENDDVLRNNFGLIIMLDKTFAKALLGKEYNGTKPLINNKGIVNLVNVRHPLLRVSKVIPNNIYFGKDYDGIVITGPNTGGKTVLLKTIGLISLMTKYGLLIPADEGSQVMIYDHVFCDIGDDQSIENNLSTFSSHMQNIVSICNQVTENSLVLLDEVGSGTDPVEGSSLAIAILEYFLNHHVSFITTTHYPRLKNFAFENSNITNASMEFDLKTQLPTYRLVIGKTGSSNALNIASNLGLNEEIISLAKAEVDKTDDDSMKLIKNLELKISTINKKETILNKKLEEANILKKEYTKKISQIENERNNILKKANDDAQKKIDEATNSATKILENIKQLQNKNLKLHEIIAAKKDIDDLKNHNIETNVIENKDTNFDVRIGEQVYLPSYGQYGEVIKINKDQTYDIRVGIVTLHLAKTDINKVKETVNNLSSCVVSAGDNIFEKKSVSLSLDLRGKRYDEASTELDKYIDDLVLANIKEASIIHGFGTGAMRELVQNYCKKSPLIKAYRYGGAGDGGLGATIISLK